MKSKNGAKSKFPKGWNEQRVRRVLEYYEKQTDEEAAAEIEKGLVEADTMMPVPHELVPVVRTLIARYQLKRSARRHRK